MATSRTNSVIRNWIAGLTLAFLLVGSSVAAYVGLNGRIASLEKDAEALQRIEAKLDKLEAKSDKQLEQIGDLNVAVGKLKVQVGILVQQNDGYEY